MDIRDLRYLVTIAGTSTLTEAASALRVTHQAVGKALRALEAEVGEPLFERRAGELVPTELGRAMAEAAHDLVERFDEFRCDFLPNHAQGAGPGGTRDAYESLTIAMVVGGSEALPPHLLDSFMAANPHVSLGLEEMTTDMVLATVSDGGCDLGIVGSHPELLGGLEYCCVQRNGVWLLVPQRHPLAKRTALELADLDGEPLVTPGSHNHVHRFVLDRCARAGARPDVRAMCTDVSMLLRVVREQRALCFGYPPGVVAAPEGLIPVPLVARGVEEFGTYVLRRAAGRSGEARPPKRAARLFWEMSRALERRA